MTTSTKTPIQSEIEGAGPLSPSALGYLCANTRQSYFSYIHQKLSEAEDSGLRRKDIARRLNKSPGRLSHLLGAPGNWTLDTIAELLVAISREEFIPDSLPILRDRNHNCTNENILEHNLHNLGKVSINTQQFSWVTTTSTSVGSYVAL